MFFCKCLSQNHFVAKLQTFLFPSKQSVRNLLKNNCMKQMKRWMLTTVLICCGLIVITSCSSDDDNYGDLPGDKWSRGPMIWE